MNELLKLIDAEIAKLNQIKVILSAKTVSPLKKKRGRPLGSTKASLTVVKPKHVLSPEAKARIAAAQKKRWASYKRAAKKAATQEVTAA